MGELAWCLIINCSISVTVNKHKEWKIVEGLEMSDFAKSMLKITGEELVSEKAEAMEILA